MIDYYLTDAEENLMDIVWQYQPLASTRMVELCAELFNWKKSTTYTMLKRLQNKSVLVNDRATIRATISKEQFYAEQSKRFVDSKFGGSLPQFITAFSRRTQLSKREIDALKALINQYEEGLK